jgi:hypothetical protein
MVEVIELLWQVKVNLILRDLKIFGSLAFVGLACQSIRVTHLDGFEW